jgi:nucleoside 2-deoxyribosyltransferase
MATITVSSSSRHYPQARRLAAALEAAGHTVHTPEFDFDETVVKVNKGTKAELTHAFFEKIRASDALLVNDIGGYAGVSVCLEVGYAHGQGVPVYFVEDPTEWAVAALGTIWSGLS